MKCKVCDTEMLVDRSVEDIEKGTETFIYKCPNPRCENYGYKEEPSEE